MTPLLRRCSNFKNPKKSKLQRDPDQEVLKLRDRWSVTHLSYPFCQSVFCCSLGWRVPSCIATIRGKWPVCSKIWWTWRNSVDWTIRPICVMTRHWEPKGISVSDRNCVWKGIRPKSYKERSRELVSWGKLSGTLSIVSVTTAWSSSSWWHTAYWISMAMDIDSLGRLLRRSTTKMIFDLFKNVGWIWVSNRQNFQKTIGILEESCVRVLREAVGRPCRSHPRPQLARHDAKMLKYWKNHKDPYR